MIEYGLSIRGREGSEDGAKICDMAVSALGKICEFHRGNIDGPEVIIFKIPIPKIDSPLAIMTESNFFILL